MKTTYKIIFTKQGQFDFAENRIRLVFAIEVSLGDKAIAYVPIEFIIMGTNAALVFKKGKADKKVLLKDIDTNVAKFDFTNDDFIGKFIKTQIEPNITELISD